MRPKQTVGRPKSKRPNIDKAYAKYLIESSGLTISRYSAMLGYKNPSAVSHFLSGRHYSQAFWDDFFSRFQLKQAS